jgi:ATP-binding cassette, subfamily B, bacterial PglK
MTSGLRSFFADYWIVIGNSRKRLPYVLVALLLSAALDLVAVLLMAPFIAMLLGQTALLGKFGQFLLTFQAPGLGPLRILAIALLSVFAIKAFAAFFLQYVVSIFAESRRARLLKLLLTSYQQRSYEFHLATSSTVLINRAIVETTQISAGLLTPSLRLVADSTIGIALLIVLALTDWRAVALLVSVLLVLSALIATLIRRPTARAIDNLLQANQSIYQWVVQSLRGLREIRILGREAYFLHRLDKPAMAAAKSSAMQSALSSAPRHVIEFGLILFVVLLSLLATLRQAQFSEMIPVLGTFAVAAVRLMPAANAVFSAWTQIRAHRKLLAEMAAELRMISPATRTLIDRQQALAPHSHKTIKQPPIASIEGRNLSYTYPERQEPALRNANFHIRRGQIIGIMGRSGAGKSTLADLLLGLLQPSNGDFLIDGVAIGANIKSLQRRTAYIPQQVYLLDDTLRRNVALGVADEDIDDADVLSALEQAQLSSFVQQLPAGLDTLVGEAGIRLSGGQRQRVAIARAIYHDREIIVMDEATSALDPETERDVMQAIGALHGQRTIIVIAHKASILSDADQILYVENQTVRSEDHSLSGANRRKATNKDNAT